jgi:hypothetical protein
MRKGGRTLLVYITWLAVCYSPQTIEGHLSVRDNKRNKDVPPVQTGSI